MALPIVTLQFLVYPVISRRVTVGFFGIILTIIAIKNTLSFTTGTSLNNVRLLRESERSVFKDSKDYNLIFIFSQLLSLITALFLAYTYQGSLNIFDALMLFFIFVLSSFKIYGSTFYRINLNFKRIMMVSVLNVAGIMVGLLFYVFNMGSWIIIFILSELLSVLYVLKTTPVLKEHKKLSVDFKNIKRDYLHLFSNALVSNLMKYLDRFLISPLIGPEKVAIYYVAAIISRITALITGPLNSVVLSYTAKHKSRIDKKLFYKYIWVILITSAAQFLFVIFFSDFIIKSLYPQLYEHSKDYIILASTGIIIGISSNILHPLIISCSDLKWQPRINAVYSSFYLSSAFILTVKYDLYGFCYSSIASHSLKFIMMLAVCYSGINERNSRK
ncbi:MAG: hypothetical protein JXN63_07810 [Candidatus Delongbacteria bacterium]|nr:hypothetical protein [Candidatus Delongbacteria bacterium]